MRDLLNFSWNKEDLLVLPGKAGERYQCTSKLNALHFFLELD